MRKVAMMMCCCWSSVFAEPQMLPPVIDNSSYPAGVALTSPASSNSAMYEVLGRLEQLQSELQQLRGVVEEQSFAISDLKKRQGHIYSDLDLRIQELAGVDVSGHKRQMAGTEQHVATTQTDIKSESTGANAVAGYSVPNMDSPVASNNSSESLVSQKDAYQVAYEILRGGHNRRAIIAFNTLLVKYPAGEYADNAQYWLGEAYKVNQEIESAKVAFTKVVTHYSGSPKVPDALLKLGYIALDQRNIAKARDYLTQVTVNHPGTTAAHLAGKKLMAMELE